MNSNTYCVIMAGGIGSRFWPVSRNVFPKQFLDILGVGSSFLQQTYQRFVRIIPPERILVVTAAPYVDLVRQQLPELPFQNILAEPKRRNTAPCIAYATYKIIQSHPDALMVVAPSDHLILGDDAFIGTIEAALEFARSHDALITVGIKPTRPETGYGYIQAVKKGYQSVGEHLVYPVKTFTEKPNAELAQVLMDSGEFYWNSGIFIWQAQSIAQQMERWIPEVNSLFKNGLSLYDTPLEATYLTKAYDECRNVSIDYGVMEHADNTYVFSAVFGWSDLGSWESFYMNSPHDKDLNVVHAAHHFTENVQRSVVYTDQKDKLLVVKGLSDYLVIDTQDALMVCPKDDTQARNLFNEMAQKQKKFI